MTPDQFDRLLAEPEPASKPKPRRPPGRRQYKRRSNVFGPGASLARSIEALRRKETKGDGKAEAASGFSSKTPAPVGPK